MTRSNAQEDTELFDDAGLALTRSFVWLLLCAFAVFAGTAVALAWYFRMDVSVTGEGVLVSAVRHKIKPAVAGIVSAVHVASGTVVRNGDRLVSLDDREWRSQLDRVDGEIAIVNSQARRLGARLISERRIAEDELRVSQIETERAALEVHRVRTEHSMENVAGQLLGWRRQPLDDLIPVRRAQGALEYTRALRRLAEARLAANDGRERELEELQRELEKWENERQRLAARLEQTTLRSPLMGVVLTANLKERQGDRVEAGETVVEVAQARSWVVETNIDEIDIPRVRVGHAARIEVSAFPHMEFEMLDGEVARIRARPTSAGYPVRVALHHATINDLEQVYELFEGMTATVRIVVDRGRILELLWKELLRGVGRVDPDALHLRVRGEAR